MTSIKDLLPESVRTLVIDTVCEPEDLPMPRLAASLAVEEPWIEEFPVTTINGVDVDLRSDGYHDTECDDCLTPLMVEIKPKGVSEELLTSKPRTAVCLPCGRIRVANLEVAIVVSPDKKENELDLTKFSNAQLAALAVKAREQMVVAKAEALPAACAEAQAERKTAGKADEVLKAVAREARRGNVLPGFTLHGKEVPALDLTDVIDLNEVVSAVMRSPYNKALSANKEDVLDKETATYSAVAEVHQRLAALAGGEVLVADLQPDVSAKVAAYAKVTGTTLEQAQAHLVSMGLIG